MAKTCRLLFSKPFQADCNYCIELSTMFAQADLEKEAATSAKLETNNNIYDALIEMLKDGQQIFRNDAALKKQFVFTYLVSIFQGEGSVSLKGYATNNLGQPVQGVTIMSADQKYVVTSNAKGRYKISRVAAGTYLFTISCPGYAPIEQLITFAAGTASTVDFNMTNLMKKAA